MFNNWICNLIMTKRKIGGKSNPSPEYHIMKRRDGSEFQVRIYRNSKGINKSLQINGCSKEDIHPSNQLSFDGWKRDLVSIFKESIEEVPKKMSQESGDIILISCHLLLNEGSPFKGFRRHNT